MLTSVNKTVAQGSQRPAACRRVAFNLHFSPRGGAKCVRGLSVRGTGRLAPHFLSKEAYLNSTVSTAGNRNEAMTGLLRASTARW